jgi:mannose/fructose-specific phosphotransferase system component IIA
MPEKLERYQVISGSNLTMIEAEANSEEDEVSDE